MALPPEYRIKFKISRVPKTDFIEFDTEEFESIDYWDYKDRPVIFFINRKREFDF